MNAIQIAETITNECDRLADLSIITFADENFSVWLSDIYNISKEQVTDGVICYAEGAQADEIVILALKEKQDAESVREALTEYKENRVKAFEGYAPK